MEQQAIQKAPASIDPRTHIGLVTLRVADLDRSLGFYEGVLGFRPIERIGGEVTLSDQSGQPIIVLREMPGAPPQPRYSTGLYHVAILMPTRADLGQILLRLAKAGWEIGQSDHLVSEALYVSDPDDNGLELYRDRPRDTWKWANGTVAMALDPIDMYGLMEEGQTAKPAWDVMPAGTTIGHMHLQVGDIPQAEHFYHDILGFDITAKMPGALFVSAGGYHHHLGLNTWQSKGAGPAPDNTAGLEAFEIALPTREALSDVQARLEANEVPFEQQDNGIAISDPWRNKIRLAVEG